MCSLENASYDRRFEWMKMALFRIAVATLPPPSRSTRRGGQTIFFLLHRSAVLVSPATLCFKRSVEMVVSLPLMSIKNTLSEMCFNTRYGASYCSKRCLAWSTLTNTCVVLNKLSKMKYERLEWCLVGFGQISCIYFLNLSIVKSVCFCVDEKFFRHSKGCTIYHFSRGCLYFVKTVPQTKHYCWEYFEPIFVFVATDCRLQPPFDDSIGCRVIRSWVRMCLHPINFTNALNIWIGLLGPLL